MTSSHPETAVYVCRNKDDFSGEIAGVLYNIYYDSRARNPRVAYFDDTFKTPGAFAGFERLLKDFSDAFFSNLVMDSTSFESIPDRLQQEMRKLGIEPTLVTSLPKVEARPLSTALDLYELNSGVPRF